jgi:hypothetical protein
MNTTTIGTRIEPAVPGSRPFYVRLTALGFALIALAGVAYIGFGLIMGNASDLAVVLAFVIVGLLIAGAVLRFGAWAQVVAALLSIAMLVLVVPFSIFNLQQEILFPSCFSS